MFGFIGKEKRKLKSKSKKKNLLSSLVDNSDL